MSIDNIPTNYNGGYPSVAEPDYDYLNIQINTTIGPESNEYIVITDENFNNPPNPTFQNKVTVYTDVLDMVSTGILKVNLFDIPVDIPVPFTVTFFNKTKYIMELGFGSTNILRPRDGITITFLSRETGQNTTTMINYTARYTYIDPNNNTTLSTGPMNSSGSENVSVGSNLQSLESGSNNVAIGFNTDTDVATSNSIIIGSNAIATESNQLVIGSAVNPITLSDTAGAQVKYLPVLLNGIKYKLALFAE